MVISGRSAEPLGQLLLAGRFMRGKQKAASLLPTGTTCDARITSAPFAMKALLTNAFFFRHCVYDDLIARPS